ncbi:MAG: LysR family transcriptional regulator [Alphaproteobacteria bacterium]|nr:LysR family transcriptional regulator [Alphaproteobacteria bacterium]OJV45029.1 MAG: hypothetical protein BGO28_00430 [Alphaproteobacteria bacterium 43-37]
MDIELLKNFCAIARFESMTKAAEYRNLSQSAVSKKLSCLEDTLGGVSLFHRCPTGLKPTEEGLTLLPYAEDILSRFQSLQGVLKGPIEAQSGELRVYVHNLLSCPWFSSVIGDFKRQNPKLDLKLSFDNLRSFALSSHHSGVYTGLTCREPEGDSQYIWRKLGSFYEYPFAHPNYINEHGTPNDFESLDQHRILRLENYADWPAKNEKQLNCLQYLGRQSAPREPSMHIDEATAMRSLVSAGIGIGMLPRHLLSAEEGTQVLQGTYDPKEHGFKRNLYLVYPTYLKNYQRIKLIKDHLLEALIKAPELFEVD